MGHCLHLWSQSRGQEIQAATSKAGTAVKMSLSSMWEMQLQAGQDGGHCVRPCFSTAAASLTRLVTQEELSLQL